jgi:hypothetical protein
MKCLTCEKVQEVITMKASDPLPTKCECGGELKKVLGGNFAFDLIGEAWAADGYSYNYMNCKAGTDQKVPCIHSRKTINEKLKKIRMKDDV